MAGLIINKEKMTPELAEKLASVCPFGALSLDNGDLSVGAGCRMCGVCVKASGGALNIERNTKKLDISDYRGIAVFAPFCSGELHKVSLELLGKARELAGVISHPVYALIIGYNTDAAANTLLRAGADKVFVYDHPSLEYYSPETYTNVFSDFIEKIKPSSVLVGATMLGRTLAPRVAARFSTGLTADCTVLEMKENSDLVQIRPAFGGNIMARIVTPRTRPQFCTARYKIFKEPTLSDEFSGVKVPMKVTESMLKTDVEILSVERKPRDRDISEADIIVAVGRGLKSKSDLPLVYALADALGAETACTRPLVENGWFDPRRQIGLSGRTVNAKLIITLGISGSVQFAAGMKGSEYIVAVNSDKTAPIFDIAHDCFVGDIYEIVPKLLEKMKV